MRLVATLCFGLAAAGIGLAPAVRSADMEPTPRQTRGPFYPKTFPQERDNDLASVQGQTARGDLLIISGRVMTREGTPVREATVEIWQTNSAGRYHHEDDHSPEPIDPGFQGWGETLTDEKGAYRFRTVKPRAYSGRTPHVHFSVKAPDRRPFITQMYFEDAPENERDFLLRFLSREERARLMVKPTAVAGADGLHARFDIVLP